MLTVRRMLVGLVAACTSMVAVDLATPGLVSADEAPSHAPVPETPAEVAPEAASEATSQNPDHVPFTGSFRVSRTGSHSGGIAIDFALPSGTTVRAAGAGTVISSSTHSQAGHYIAIYHSSANRTSYYYHLSSRSVSVGASVSRGQAIGRSGSTGNSTGPHLHYQEVPGRVPGVPLQSRRVDPGTMYGCRGSSTNRYSGWSSMPGRTVSNDGTGCRGGSTPPPRPTRFSSDARSRLFFDRGGDRINLEVCANNIRGQNVTVRMTRPGRDFGNVTRRASSRCLTFYDLDGAGPVFRNTTYTTRAALNRAPSTSWPVPCARATNLAGLCDRATLR